MVLGAAWPEGPAWCALQDHPQFAGTQECQNRRKQARGRYGAKKEKG